MLVRKIALRYFFKAFSPNLGCNMLNWPITTQLTVCCGHPDQSQESPNFRGAVVVCDGGE